MLKYCNFEYGLNFFGAFRKCKKLRGVNDSSNLLYVFFKGFFSNLKRQFTQIFKPSFRDSIWIRLKIKSSICIKDFQTFEYFYPFFPLFKG